MVTCLVTVRPDAPSGLTYALTDNAVSLNPVSAVVRMPVSASRLQPCLLPDEILYLTVYDVSTPNTATENCPSSPSIILDGPLSSTPAGASIHKSASLLKHPPPNISVMASTFSCVISSLSLILPLRFSVPPFFFSWPSARSSADVMLPVPVQSKP